MIGDIFEKTPLSLYQPPKEVQEATRYAKDFYNQGHQILTKSWPELNDLSLIERDNRDKKTFNAWVDESSDDPKEAWKWIGTRSMARNRAIAMHTHLTSGFMFPMVGAQDQNNDEDRGVGDFMRDMLLWMGENSNYKSSFLQVAMGMITSPVTYLGAEFVEVMQKVKNPINKTIDIAIDQELSGFNAPVYGCSDVLITNAYVQNIQRQTCVIKQRYLDYSDAEKKYANKENWEFVQKGVNSILNEDDGLFYDVYDPENPSLVKETVLMWRGEDLEITYLGGVYMGDDNIEWNPIKHRDNFNNPKYDVIPFGYHRISEHFAFYKSLVNSLYWDDQLLDEMYANVMNREFIDLIPPIAITGEDNIDTSVVFPGAQFVSSNKDARVQTILPPSNANKYGALQYIENSLKEGSISDTQMGQLPEASQKAYSVAKADQQAKIMIKGVGQSLGESIIQYGKLMINIAIRHLSTAQIEEIAGEARSVKYRQFVLPGVLEGRNITKILRYDKNLIGKTMTEKEKKMMAVDLYAEGGDDKSIAVLNPELAAKMKYLIRIDPEEMFAESKEYTQQLLLSLYAQLRQDPFVDGETLVRKLVYAFFRSEGDELLLDKSEIEKMMQMQQQKQQQGQTPRIPPKQSSPINRVQNMV